MHFMTQTNALASRPNHNSITTKCYSMVGSLLLIIIGTHGCASNRAANNLAAQMNRLTLEYDAVTKAKVEAEREFYNQQRRILREILGGTSAVTEPDSPDYNVKLTVGYGRIATDTNRDAVLLAESFASAGDAPKVWSALIAFLEGGLKEDREAYLEAHRRQQQLGIDLLTALEKIDRQTQRLSNVKSGLIELEKEPTIESQLKQFLALGEVVAKQLRSSEKEK
jgi:hypothetical protein